MLNVHKWCERLFERGDYEAIEKSDRCADADERIHVGNTIAGESVDTEEVGFTNNEERICRHEGEQMVGEF